MKNTETKLSDVKLKELALEKLKATNGGTQPIIGFPIGSPTLGYIYKDPKLSGK